MMRAAAALLATCWAALAGAADGAPALKIYAMESRPISYRDGEQVQGLGVELAQQVQQRLGRRDSIALVPWARANTLAESVPNVMLLTVVWTPERERFLRFVGPIFMSRIAAFGVRSRAASLRERDPGLQTLRAGARRGSVFVKLARDAGFHITDEIAATENAVRMLMLGRFDLWFEGEEIAGHAFRAAGYRMDEVEVMLRLAPQAVYFGFSPGTPDAVVQAWRDALDAMKRDGSYQRIHRKWLPDYAMPPDAQLPPAPGRRPRP